MEITGDAGVGGVKTNRRAFGARGECEVKAVAECDILSNCWIRVELRWKSLPSAYWCGEGAANREIEVAWPTSKLVQRFRDVAVDRAFRLRRGGDAGRRFRTKFPRLRLCRDGAWALVNVAPRLGRVTTSAAKTAQYPCAGGIGVDDVGDGGGETILMPCLTRGIRGPEGGGRPAEKFQTRQRCLAKTWARFIFACPRNWPARLERSDLRYLGITLPTLVGPETAFALEFKRG